MKKSASATVSAIPSGLRTVTAAFASHGGAVTVKRIVSASRKVVGCGVPSSRTTAPSLKSEPVTSTTVVATIGACGVPSAGPSAAFTATIAGGVPK